MGNAGPKAPKLSEEEERTALDYDVSVRRIANLIRARAMEQRESVVVMAGAGISVSAGIPDFRTPGTGLYDNLQKYDLPEPTCIFDINYFRKNPRPFCMLAREMYPGTFRPTPAHFFIKLLEMKGVLKRCFTQNIDTLERVAGISAEKLVEAHGSFGEAHCIDCRAAYSQAWVKEEIFAGNVPRCPVCVGSAKKEQGEGVGGPESEQEEADPAAVEKEGAGGGTGGDDEEQEEREVGLVKPDIVFFGEGLPERFREKRTYDLPSAEILIIMGTSLEVSPFCELVHDVPATCPRLLLNMELVGQRDRRERRNGGLGLRCDETDNYRDAALLGPCDDAVRLLAEYVGWADDLRYLEESWERENPGLPPLASPPPPPPAVTAATEGATAEAAELGAEERSVLTDAAARALVHNWRKPAVPLPPLVPFDNAARPAPGTLSCPKVMCTLLKPTDFDDIRGGRPAHFRVGLRNGAGDVVDPMPRIDSEGGGSGGGGGARTETFASSAVGGRDTSLDYLALYSAGAGDASERTDRDMPFRDPNESDDEAPNSETEEFHAADEIASAAIAAASSSSSTTSITDRMQHPPYVKTRPLRLRVPWVRYELPYDFEVWYVDGARDEVLGRWGPLTLKANAPEDTHEENLPAGRPEGLPDLKEGEMDQLVAMLAEKFSMPAEMVRAMVHQKMMDQGNQDGDMDGDNNAENSVEGSPYDVDDGVDDDVDIDLPASGSSGAESSGGALKSAFGALKSATGKGSSAGSASSSGSGDGGSSNGGALKSAFGALKSATGKGDDTGSASSSGSGDGGSSNGGALKSAFGAFKSATGKGGEQ